MLKIRRNALTKIFDVFKIESSTIYRKGNQSTSLISWNWIEDNQKNKLSIPFNNIIKDIKNVWTIDRNFISKVLTTWNVIAPLFSSEIEFHSDNEFYTIKPFSLKHKIQWTDVEVLDFLEMWIAAEKHFWEKEFKFHYDFLMYDDGHKRFYTVSREDWETGLKLWMSSDKLTDDPSYNWFQRNLRTRKERLEKCLK